MDSKLQELTEKIYREGVEKGEQQAGEIIAAAEKQSAAISKARAARPTKSSPRPRKKPPICGRTWRLTCAWRQHNP